MKQVKVKLKDNTIVIGDEFDMEDYKKFKQIFRKWTDINSDLKQFGGRNLNVPDVFSEALYCIFFNAVRTNGTAHSYDAVDKETGEGIQIKSASIQNDCTSFGPTSTWDKLIFADLETPILYNVNFGHSVPRCIIPYDAEATIDFDNKRITINTPIFEENNLLASGVQIEASSVEDKCGDICFNVYIYNVQDGIEINYYDGSSKLA